MRDVETLVSFATQVGLDAGEARAAIQLGQYAQDVCQDEQQAQQLGISGVPFFVVGGQYGVSGAQSPEAFAQALNQVWNERHPKPFTMLGSSDAAMCEDGSCAVPQKK